MCRKIWLVFTLLWITATGVQAWDNGGHLLVDEIADGRLRPEVVGKIASLLPLIDASCHEGRPYNFVSVGTWLDDVRKVNREWSKWHYVDVPCAGDAFVEPNPPHALWALDRAVAVLGSKEATPQARAEALGQVIHLVADIHQPLHTASRNDDRGGNAVLIEPLIDGAPGPANLHAFWDAAYRYDAVQGQIVDVWPKHSVNIAQIAKELLVQAPDSETPVPLAQKPWHQWARETHALACQSGWPAQGGSPVALTPDFVHQAHEIADRQLVRAGVRLAALLNEALGDR
jgi:hypothetical protein